MNTYTFDEIPAGLKCRFTRTVTNEMEDSFREMSGDENPLHKDDRFARESISGGRFTGHVTFGMLTASLYSTLCGMYIPGEYSLLHSMELKFLRPVYAGDTLTVEGEVTDKQEGLRLLRVRAGIMNQHGKCVSKADIKVMVLR